MYLTCLQSIDNPYMIYSDIYWYSGIFYISSTRGYSIYTYTYIQKYIDIPNLWPSKKHRSWCSRSVREAFTARRRVCLGHGGPCKSRWFERFMIRWVETLTYTTWLKYVFLWAYMWLYPMVNVHITMVGYLGYVFSNVDITMS